MNATGNISVFNGTALHWSAYAQTYDGRRVAAPELLTPVALGEAYRYSQGQRPGTGYTRVEVAAGVSYDLVVVQDDEARRANAVLLMRKAMGAILGSTAFRFGGGASCLNDFIAAVAPQHGGRRHALSNRAGAA